MALLDNAVGKRHDIPLTYDQLIAAAAAGTGADYEVPVAWVPKMPTQSAGQSYLNAKGGTLIRSVGVIASAAITGVATNNFALQLNHYRGGVLQTDSPINVVTFAAGTSVAKFASITKALPLAGASALILQPDDVLTIQRLSAGTGLASPALSIIVDYDAALR